VSGPSPAAPSAAIVVSVSAAYLLACLILGILPGRKQSDSAAGYVAGDRTLGLLVMYFITGATIFSAFAFLGGPGWAYKRGVAAFYILGYGALGFLPFYFLGPRAARLGRRYGFITQAQMVAARFGRPSIAGVMALVSAAAFVPYLALQMKGAGYVLSSVTRDAVPVWAGAAAVYGVVLLYVVRSGVIGVGWTNTFQGILMMALAWGLERRMLRFNRVEGLSAGLYGEIPLSPRTVLSASTRLGTGDGEPYGTLRLRHGPSERSWTLEGYHRLASMNDWHEPFGLSESFFNLVFGNDRAELMRVSGASVRDTSTGRSARWEMEAFGERQRPVTRTTEFYLLDELGLQEDSVEAVKDLAPHADHILLDSGRPGGRVVEVGAVLGPAGDAVERHLSSYFRAHRGRLPAGGLYDRVLREMERPLLQITLDATNGNQVKAADVLGLNRNTLRKKVRELGIDVTRGRAK